MSDAIFPQKISFVPLSHTHNPDRLTGDYLGLLLHNPDQITVDLGEHRSHLSIAERSQPYTPPLNLREGTSALQKAITEHRLTDCLEHLESLGFLVEEQLFCLNLAQHLQRGCGV